MLYIPVNNFSVMSGRVFLGLTSTKQGLMCLAQGHNAVTAVRLKPASSLSQVKHSTTEPLQSLSQWFNMYALLSSRDASELTSTSIHCVPEPLKLW